MTNTLFSQVYASLSVDHQINLDERAAILEFEGGFDRATAELMALSQYLDTATANGHKFKFLFSVMPV